MQSALQQWTPGAAAAALAVSLLVMHDLLRSLAWLQQSWPHAKQHQARSWPQRHPHARLLEHLHLRHRRVDGRRHEMARFAELVQKPAAPQLQQ